MKLAIQVFESPTGPLLADWTHRAVGARFSTGAHGFESLQTTVPMPQAEAFQWYDRQGLPHVVCTGADGMTAFEGRLEDIAIVPDGLQVVALGYWRALADRPHTALWSDTMTTSWRPLTEAERTDAHPKRFTFDTQDRLFIAPRKGEQFSPTVIGYLALPPLSVTNRNLRTLEFTYAFKAPADWTFRASRRTAAWALNAHIVSVVGNGAEQTAIVNASTVPGSVFAATVALTFSLEYTGAAANYTGETGTDVYVKITGVRVKSSNATTLLASEIAAQMAALASTLNPTQLSSSTALVATTDVDLQNEVYQDELMSDVLTRLTRLGDSANRQYETGVWEGRRLHFRVRGSAGRTWYVDATALELERSLEPLANSVYAVYQATGGATVRSAASDDAASIARYGVTRRRALPARTTSSTQAASEVAAYLTDRKDPVPRAGLTFTKVFDATGARWPLWAVRAGDTLVIRNLSPTLSTSVDRIRTMRIAATSYDVGGDTLDVTPESPTPSLESLLVRGDPTFARPVSTPVAGPPASWGNDPW